MRLRLAVLLESVDAYSEVFDPYVDPPELVVLLLSDDLTSIATGLAHGLRHYRAGRVERGAVVVAVLLRLHVGQPRPSAVLRALQSVVAHDRLDAEFEGEADQVAAAGEMLDPAQMLDPDDAGPR